MQNTFVRKRKKLAWIYLLFGGSIRSIGSFGACFGGHFVTFVIWRNFSKCCGPQKMLHTTKSWNFLEQYISFRQNCLKLKTFVTRRLNTGRLCAWQSVLNWNRVELLNLIKKAKIFVKNRQKSVLLISFWWFLEKYFIK